jgi:hypothetical protein
MTLLAKFNVIYESALKYITDPFNFDTHLHEISSDIKSIEAQIATVTKRLSELKTCQTFEEVLAEYNIKLLEAEDRASFYASSLASIGDVIPDMLWMKSVSGEYQYANKCIRDFLLFDDSPIGKTDGELVTAALARFGADKHNFGMYCISSDVLVIEHGYRKRFIEYGLSGGVPLVLEVYKNVVRDTNHSIIATVGCGRDITDVIFTLLSTYKSAEELKPQRASDKAVDEYLDKYLYEDTTSEDTLISFYHKYRSSYE